MTDPRKVLDDAVEAAVAALDTNFRECSASTIADTIILAALPVIGEAMVAIPTEISSALWERGETVAGTRDAQLDEGQAFAVGKVAAAQRAFIERMRG